MAELDWRVLQAVNGLVGRYPALDVLAWLLANDYFTVTVMALILVALWFSGRDVATREGHQRAILSATVAVLMVTVAVGLCNLFYFRPRPFTDHAVNLLFYRPASSSFPGGAVAVGFALAAAVCFGNRWAGGFLLAVAALLAVGRVYCGVHYPSDVLAGAALGAAAGCAVSLAGFLRPMWDFVVGMLRRVCLA